LAYADECVELAEGADSLKNVIKGRRLRAQGYLAQGNADAAAEEFETALNVARKIGNPSQLWKTLAAMGRHREALEVIDRVAASLTDEKLRATFLESGRVQRIRDAAGVRHS
jgi:tetratricopeptide (TPR) repeat protein